jgi:hypothetical protein
MLTVSPIAVARVRARRQILSEVAGPSLPYAAMPARRRLSTQSLSSCVRGGHAANRDTWRIRNESCHAMA